MADKMQPGRFTIRFNMNDPQQRAAVEILNRMGRQKAQFIAQALTHYFDIITNREYRGIHRLVVVYDSIRPKGERLKNFGGTDKVK